MSLKKSLLFGSLVTAMCLFFSSSTFASFGIPENLQCDAGGQPGIRTSIIIIGDRCVPAGSSFQSNPIVQTLTAILALLAGGVGLAVVGGIVWGGILYMTARGNSSQTQQAITVIINSCIGLLLFIFMFAIINFLIPGGVLA